MGRVSTSEHQHHEGADGCLITKAEAAGLAGVTERTVENWVADGLVTKHTKGPAGYWVRFCRLEVVEKAGTRVTRLAGDVT
jgi:hypothetical protein